MRKRGLAIACAATLAAIASASAQTYPARPITMIVPFAAGGPNDTIGRIMAERMRAPLGQPVMVENVVGANGTVGVGRAARAARKPRCGSVERLLPICRILPRTGAELRPCALTWPADRSTANNWGPT
jgi:tripartite-type tricarboxylate transporter receptor subunit TctC